MKPLLLILLLSLAALLVSEPAPREQVGPLHSGGFLLNSGWRLQPAGHQVAVGTMPMSTALSPEGKFLLVLNGGDQPPSPHIVGGSGGNKQGAGAAADERTGVA